MSGKAGIQIIFGLSSALSLVVLECRDAREYETTAGTTLFSLLPAKRTGIDFVNQLEYTEAYNPYTFRNFFNGGGVALGDFNNDGLLDIFFCGNLVDNRLYLNRGDFRFEDITGHAGVASPGVWSSGVALADINGDGLLDIYVCKSGDPQGENRHNELFINQGPDENGQVRFVEMAREYGIADLGLSTHAAFFDYDGDGDLDLYLLNNSLRSVGGYDLREGLRDIRDTLGGNKLYRQDQGPGGRIFFTDVSEEAGIYGSAIGFGLGVTIGDVNRDGWPDIYVSNDFFERDYLYLNNRDGTFSEILTEAIAEISLSSMGADLADLNNDGFPEIFVTDMLPEGERRFKTKVVFENWNKYRLNIQHGYHRQFTRNTLQWNNGDGVFSEIGRMAGVEATDWSWGALIFDMDNDGRKDIFVANGILKDLTDQDYVNFYSDPSTVRAIMQREGGVIARLIDAIPSEPVPNYAFHNEGIDPWRGPRFRDRAAEWGLGQPSFSNGSAYGDLDNDGDLDLVINNVNMPAFVYRNEADSRLSGRANFLIFDLRGAPPNTHAVGAQVTLSHQGQTHFREQHPMRGFQSCVDPRAHFGLGALSSVDTVIVRWPDGKYTLLTDVATNQILKLDQREANYRGEIAPAVPELEPIFRHVPPGLTPDYRHRENDFSDFDRDRLLFHMLSAEGPRVASGDVNGDGLDDFFIGGAKDSPGALYLQTPGGGWRRVGEALLEADKASEDTGALFFDANGDGHLDLYVCSGGSEFSPNATALVDRLYLNDGRGDFTKSQQLLPSSAFTPSSCVAAADFDGDGDLDLFVGARMRPSQYGLPARGFLLENDGKGNFRDVTQERAPGLIDCGMITDAQWIDVDGDGQPDLIAVGEYMPVKVFLNDKGYFKAGEETGGNGWWNRVLVADINDDGHPDLVLGNHGFNTRFRALSNEPVRLHVRDFDQNGAIDPILTVYNQGEAYPLILLHDLVKQLPGLRKRYLKYENYQEQTVFDIFGQANLDNAITLEMHHSATSIAINDGSGRFELRPLPWQAQLAPVYGMAAADFDGDGRLDLLLGGNFSRAKPEVGAYHASRGLFLKGLGEGRFEVLSARRSGWRIRGEVRDIQLLRVGNRKIALIAKNDAPLEMFEY
jgi:hypothetical protein